MTDLCNNEWTERINAGIQNKVNGQTQKVHRDIVHVQWALALY